MQAQAWICPTCKDDHWWPEGPYCKVVAAIAWLLAEARWYAEEQADGIPYARRGGRGRFLPDFPWGGF